MPFLPITKKEMQSLGWTRADFIIVTGDAYVDHPSFGTAIISRVLENEGFKVCIISQPKSDDDYLKFGKPRLAFLVKTYEFLVNKFCYVDAHLVLIYKSVLDKIRMERRRSVKQEG